MSQLLYSIEDAAKTLAISPWTLRLYVRQGKVKVVRIGRRVLLSSSELERLMQHGCPSGTTTDSRNEAEEYQEDRTNAWLEHYFPEARCISYIVDKVLPAHLAYGEGIGSGSIAVAREDSRLPANV